MNNLCKLKNDVEKMKNKLRADFKRKGARENFGDKEIRQLEAKYDKCSIAGGTPEGKEMLDVFSAFSEWCLLYNGSDGF